MSSFLGLIRDIAILSLVAVAVIALSFSTTRTITLAPDIKVEFATTSPALPVAEETPVEVPKIEEPVPAVSKPAPKPVAEPLDQPLPKVEELGLTLDDAIDAVTTLAQGQTQTGQSVNDRVRAALVNILCTVSPGGESVSGSGVIIDPRGVILTNAHVAQFFLLKDYPVQNNVSCVIRTGSPAYPRYTAELMFLPPAWMRDNARKITQEAPTGTGERDYALVRITGGVSSSITLPTSFPFLLVAKSEPEVGADVIQAGYAAGFLGNTALQNELYASSAWTKIRDIFTFNANTVDLVALGGSIVAQSGSSGGPVANTDGILLAIIVTNSGTGDTSTRDLKAITTSYIVRDFEQERGKSLQSVLSTEDLATEVDIFNRVYFPSAKAALIAELEK